MQVDRIWKGRWAMYKPKVSRNAIAVWQNTAPDREFERFCNKIDECV